MYKPKLTRLILRKGYNTFYQQDMSSCEALNRPVESSIRAKLEAALKPLHCDVINESYMHNVLKNSETHFKIVVVSEKFDEQPLIKNCREVYMLYQLWLKHQSNGRQVIKWWLRVLLAGAVLENNVV
ncbi:bolA-like protein 1 isoform X2 [Monomorium pharaonis]|uniref:bolA-like protein 1 isoform X2 n=1 Tax=Monomorium pharaonis TaxID=307658 RepID=UPI00063F4D5E|nr:bolA-like protein 1 isoform X2 [Monomorium pharaonis]